MGDASEVVRESGVNDFRVATEQQLFHLDHRLLGIAPGTVRVLFGWKIGFEDRFQHQHCPCHADPIPHSRDAQRPELAVGLRDEHSSDKIRLVALLPERKRQFAKPPLDATAVSEQFSELIGCPISKSLTTCCVSLELRSLPSPGVTRLQRYCEPLRHPKAPDLSLAGVRLVIADHAMGLPVLRTLSLCTCRRQYPGAATGRTLRSTRPAISAFPDMAVGSACTSSFSRLARRSLALRPAHSRCHQFVTR